MYLMLLSVLISLYYSNIRIFFGGFSADEIRRRIRLAEFFSADKNSAANSAIGGGLGLPNCNSHIAAIAINDVEKRLIVGLHT